jgi:hypothetical protein
MTIRTSLWVPYQPTVPTHATGQPLDTLRNNLLAIHAYSATGFVSMWNYTNSVTRGEGSPGTEAEPVRKYWWRGSGNAKKWIKAELTWDSPDLTKAVFYYSEDNESTYVPMLDADRNYVLTMTYASNNLESSLWGNTP